MKYFKKIVGEHIYLSPRNTEDAETFANWFCDYAMTDGIGASSRIVTPEGEREWLQTTKDDTIEMVIVRVEDDKLLGSCSIKNINPISRTATLGILIGDEENRSKGYGTEAIGLMLEYGFDFLNLNNINLCVKSFNERAIACYKKVGFKEAGRRRESYFLGGKYYDDIYMDILAREFTKKYMKNRNL